MVLFWTSLQLLPSIWLTYWLLLSSPRLLLFKIPLYSVEFNHYRIRNKIFFFNYFFFPAVFTTSGQMKGQHHLPLKTCQLALDFHRYHKHRASHRIHLWLPIYHSVFPVTVHHDPYGGEVTERARGCYITDQQEKEKQQCSCFCRKYRTAFFYVEQHRRHFSMYYIFCFCRNFCFCRKYST